MPLSLCAGAAVAEDAGAAVLLEAQAKCQPLPGPGKVQCTVHARPRGGRLRWGDVIVLSAPPFAPPLRTRLAKSDATRSDIEGADFSLALAATGDGVGSLRVLVRAVVCGASGCRTVSVEAAAAVTVGSAGQSS